MKNEKLKRMMKSCLSFGCTLLMYALNMALIGAIAIVYYQAGRAEMFNYPKDADEFCEQHEMELTATNDLVLELRKNNKGEVYGEE